MRPALAIIEFDSVAVGIHAGDAMVKRAAVDHIRAGTVHPGRYLVARYPKSSRYNEHCSIGIDTPSGPVLVRQIAGFVARRIKCYAAENCASRQGEEMGFIKFGSRLDLFLPVDSSIQIELDQQVTGSVTPIARFK